MRKEIIDNAYYSASMESRVGGRKENQDHCLGHRLEEGEDCSLLLLSVCDGMGGAAGGATASRMAVETINATVTSQLEVIRKAEDDKVLEVLAQAIKDANEEVFARSMNDPTVRGMGSTSVTLLITPYAAYVAHVGDSRCYQLRKRKKVFRTFDHSRVFELVALGVMDEEQARCSASSNIISRAIGVRKEIEVEVQRIAYKAGDRFVLCCDGIWNVMPENELLELFNEQDSHADATQKVADVVDRIGRDSGQEYDNLSVVICDVHKNSIYQVPLSTILTNQLKKITSILKKK